MVRKAFSLVCSITALIGIMMTGMPTPIKIILVVIVVSFMIFVISTGSEKIEATDRQLRNEAPS